MIGRELLPFGIDHSIYLGALEDLADAAKLCPMTRTEQAHLAQFIAQDRTHCFLFKTRAIERPPGYGIVITLLPGYIQLLQALRAGAPQTMSLIRTELARRQGQTHT